MEDELLKDIEKIMEHSDFWWSSAGGGTGQGGLPLFRYKDCAKSILTLIRKREIELLEGLKWEPRESWADDVVRHNGQIDMKIKKLKEVSNDNNNS